MRRRIHHEQETGELNIVPYLDVVVNLVMFMLLSMTGLVAFGVLNVSAPKIAEGSAAAAEAAADQPKLLLTVAIGREGFYIAGAGGVLGQDAATPDAARPPTVPKRDGRYDFAALTDALARIKERFPKEQNVILSADPDVVYDTLIQTMDACRDRLVTGPDGKPTREKLFPAVSLSLIG